jgi:hypothetical protein
MVSARWQDRRQPKVCPAGCQQEHARLLDIPTCFCLIYRIIILRQWLTTPAMAASFSLRSGSALAPDEGAIAPGAHASPGCVLVEPSRPARRAHPGKTDHKPVSPSVLVVFADHVACPWLRPLRRGFRHCFVVLRAGPVWLACEPLKDRIELDALELPGQFDLASFYRAQGHRVLLGERPLPRKRRRFALAPLTCVTVVKRLLGIDAPWVWTPWQLYAHLCGPEHGFSLWSGPPPRQNSTVGNQRENSALDTA